ncbi:hypothetical protein [Mucilaginibacter lacusdianchii]|uniref:hypothetical protein n=1 Tax=Mucilaginibacter lacusdianchii TaxID=2684211 RepID=UPI00131AA800|nr:hypothetical protein [Mucilaginibacter sp. JXJ CY 39]
MKRLLIGRSELTKVTGTIDKQYRFYTEGRSSSVSIVISLSDHRREFAIQDTKERAFKYLSTHDVQGSEATILYDEDGFTGYSDRIFHIYELYIGKQQLMTLDEAKHPNIVGLEILSVFEVVAIGGAYLAERSKRKKFSIQSS